MTCRKCHTIGAKMYIDSRRLWCSVCHTDVTNMWIRR
nr:MAG TPA: cytochrome c554 [Caudoviricetes sp.]